MRLNESMDFQTPLTTGPSCSPPSQSTISITIPTTPSFISPPNPFCSHCFLQLNFFPLSLMCIQPPNPFFSLFPPLKLLPTLSHVYAAHMHACSQPWRLQYLVVSTHYDESRYCNSKIVCHLTTLSRAHTHAWPPLACYPKDQNPFFLFFIFYIKV